ncbi:MAG TPA: MerR family transcriptional regulator [Trueperaceae bacterium]|nr:MerR family transcriptional regulator [Trueperaceae bacterium]
MNETNSSKEFITTGVFAKRSALSYKALRLYESMGLLMPAFVDESNSYRYYSIDQIEKAKLIALLKQLDMPLTRISEVMSLKCAVPAYIFKTFKPAIRLKSDTS